MGIIAVWGICVVTASAAPPASFIWTSGSSSSPKNWSQTKNWTPTGTPGTIDSAFFFDTAATNQSGAVNNLVDVNFTISSLQYGNTNNFHTTQIASGKVLSIVGTNGLTVGTQTDSAS